MTFDREKFKNLVHYICLKCAPSQLGAIKLNKILWLADFRAFYELRTPITGARYIKRQFGPVPAPIVQIVEELEREGLVEVVNKPFHGRDKKEFQARGTADLSRFSTSELRIVDAAIRFVAEKHTAKSISDLSHDHIWRAAADGEELPYFTIFATPGEITEDDKQWARMEIEENG